MLTNEQFRRQMEKLRSVLPKLQESGPVHMKHPDGVSPDIILDYESCKSMLDEMDALVLHGKMPTKGFSASE